MDGIGLPTGLLSQSKPCPHLLHSFIFWVNISRAADYTIVVLIIVVSLKTTPPFFMEQRLIFVGEKF